MAGVRQFEDLAAWKLSMELNDVVFEITSTGRAFADSGFRNEIRDAARAAPALIAEGFVRFTVPEFIRYLRMARGELGEVLNDLEIGRRQNYFTAVQVERARTIANRAMGATTNLLKAKLRQLEEQQRSKRENVARYRKSRPGHPSPKH
jgi:four helix bundle protein